MSLLILGLAIWIALHLMPAVEFAARRRLIENIGLNPYKGLFSLALVADVALMVLGWQAVEIPTILYDPISGAAHLSITLMVAAFLLIGASVGQSRLRRWVPHPQLSGVAVWALAHLIANGTLRDAVLFGGLLLWSVLTIMLLNRRDGAREKPAIPPLGTELRTHAVSLVILVGVYFLHPYFTGLSPL